MHKELFMSLPPTNEVWGKVMFLHLCVILFTWGGLPPGRGLHPGEGVCLQGRGSVEDMSLSAIAFHLFCGWFQE